MSQRLASHNPGVTAWRRALTAESRHLIAEPHPRKRFSAGVVVVRRDAETWRYLLLRVYRTWDFPKGGVELGETALQAAVREVAEETMLSDLAFAWGERWCETVPYSGGKIARYYLAESPSQPVSLPVNVTLGRPEHHEFRWLRYPEARKLLPERLLPVLDWAHALVEPG